MMSKLDVRKLNAEKKYAGELKFEFEAEETLLEIPLVCFSSPVKAELHYEILEDDSVEITGKISFALKGQCSRCLKETETRVESEVEGYFLPNGDDMEDYSYKNGVIDLSEFLRDSVSFALPSVLHCEECERAIEEQNE